MAMSPQSCKNSFTVVEHLDVSGVTSLMERSVQNRGTSSVRVDVGQICCVLDDVFIIILIKPDVACTPQLVKTVVKEIMKVESTEQIRSLACCSMTIDSKGHLVAPPVIQEASA